VLAIGLLAAAVVLAGAVALRSGGSRSTPVPEPIDYVALGDSFSAGPLVPRARSDPGGCLRSTNNYPAYLADWLDVRSYRDVTCSRAQTRDLRRPQRLVLGSAASTPPQLDALSAGTDLVTIGIGGNDFRLFGSIIGTCGALRDRDPRGAPCRRSFLRRVDGRPVDTKARDARRIEGRVARVVRLVGRRAPSAEVYVVGYPRLLPEDGRCAAVRFAAGDYRWGRRIERLLNQSLRAAAARAGATYVDLRAPSRGHDACAGDEAWVNGNETVLGLAVAFHPFQSGMRGIAGAVYAAVTGDEAPSSQADARPPPGSIVRNRR
jgi:lysophospholipase L1-like esterase